MSRPSLRHLDVLLATWFGSGYLPKAPGTWGTLAAVPFGVVVGVHGGFAALAIMIVLGCLVGMWAAKGYMNRTGAHDPGAVVIDEVIGLWISYLPIYSQQPSLNAFHSAGFAFFGFVVFRIADILKPWPVSWADGLPGATGVMLDDALAGLYAAGVIFLTLELLF